MAQNFTNLIQVLKEKVEALQSGSDDLFQEVYNYGEGNFGAYPAAVILDKGESGSPIDTHRIERNFLFEITLYQEQSRAGKTPAEAATIMRSCVDAVMRSFDTDRELGGEADRVLVTDIVTDFSIRAGTFNFAKFTVNVRVIVDNFVEES